MTPGRSLAGLIDADTLERMARIARDLPGHTVSCDAPEDVPPDSDPVLRVDGVIAEDILDVLAS